MRKSDTLIMLFFVAIGIGIIVYSQTSVSLEEPVSYAFNIGTSMVVADVDNVNVDEEFEPIMKPWKSLKHQTMVKDPAQVISQVIEIYNTAVAVEVEEQEPEDSGNEILMAAIQIYNSITS
jgi:hypothetical protein